jgi:hypothetical protein
MTLSADQTILNERYRKARRREVVRSGHTAQTAAYHDHVELCISHIYPRFR